ncbi:YnbE family lipoprotein [Croceicoccus sp. Ery5]|uniref:YnbE family lipoprotein n=2 Tax=unclassified Croceicoccus TaxID=2629967 RepID=UPI00351CE085
MNRAIEASTGLTQAIRAATGPAMKEHGSGYRALRNIALALTMAAPLAGCINVNAPNDAIVIELNINIKQEVLYRLVDSAEQNIEDNPEIF